MPNQRHIYLVVVLAACFSINGCKKNDFSCHNCPVENWEDPELLPPITLKYLDAVPSMEDPLDISNIYLSNGWSVNAYLQTFDADFYSNWQGKVPYSLDSFNMNTYVARMTFLASKLTDRNLFQYPAEGVHKPAQNGLAYVYGSEDYTLRTSSLHSRDGNASCGEELHGIDASGLFKYVMERNGLLQFRSTIDSLIDFGSYGNWFNNFSNSINYTAVDFGQQPLSFVQPGDIISWKFSHHQRSGLIGIVIKDQHNKLGVLISSGSAYNDCERNFSPTLDSNVKRGPRILSLESLVPLLTNSFFYLNGTQPAPQSSGPGNEGNIYTQVNYNILRIMPSFSGTVSRSDTEYFNFLNNCEYNFYLSDVKLDIRYHRDGFLGYRVSGEIQYTYTISGPNCFYFFTMPGSLASSAYFYKDFIELDLGEKRSRGRFTGMLQENRIVGDLTVIHDGFPYDTRMELYPK